VDGGKNWVRQQAGFDKSLFAVRFTNPNEGMVAGIDGVVLHTTDGGNTWKHRPTPVTDNLFDIEVEGNIICSVGSRGAIIMSTDRGFSWQRVNSPSTFNTLSGIAAVDGRFRCVGLHGTILVVEGRLVGNFSQEKSNR
jgi:photosystem II stability/assembly factor-like uncharacterized protein